MERTRSKLLRYRCIITPARPLYMHVLISRSHSTFNPPRPDALATTSSHHRERALLLPLVMLATSWRSRARPGVPVHRPSIRIPPSGRRGTRSSSRRRAWVPWRYRERLRRVRHVGSRKSVHLPSRSQHVGPVVVPKYSSQPYSCPSLLPQIRCHMEDGKPPCTRCKHRGLPCVLNKSLQMLVDERSQ